MIHKSLSPELVEMLTSQIRNAEHILIGAGAGLSSDAGYDYLESTEFLTRYPYLERVGVHCRYHSIGFVWPTKSMEWAFYARQLEEDLYGDPPNPDGIQNVQTTGTGSIWVSYFDEGVFGNFGWSEPIGSSGLVRFDVAGKSAFRYEPVAGLDYICDCYCLNVVNERETWCCYYTDFPIVRIEHDRITGFWNAPVGGASGMAIWRDLVLMQGAYGSDEWKLLRLMQSQRAEIVNSFEPQDRFGQALKSRFSTCRGDAVWFLDAGNVYHMAVRELPV